MEDYQKQGLNMEQSFGLAPTALISLYEIYYLEGYQDVDVYENRHYALRMCSADHLSTITAPTASSIQSKGLNWAGLSYFPIGIEAASFTASAQGLPRPLLKISNKNISQDVSNTNHKGTVLDTLSTYNKYFNDMTNARVVRRTIFAKFLDGDNFPENNNVNPWGTRSSGAGAADDSAYEFSSQLFFISKKANETKESIEYELTSSLDVENVMIPNRTILGSYCSWCYRGEGCYFTGPAVSTELDDENFMMGPGQSYENSAALNKVRGKRAARSGGTSVIGEYDYTQEIGDWTIGAQYRAGDLVKTPPSSGGGGFMDGTKQIQLGGDGRLVQKHDITVWVCITDNTASLSNAPEKKSGNWVADQCSKSIDACRMRFNNKYTKNKNIRFGGYPATEGYESDSQ